jgi:hypothetical protein
MKRASQIILKYLLLGIEESFGPEDENQNQNYEGYTFGPSGSTGDVVGH